jgi:hypothetical protein
MPSFLNLASSPKTNFLVLDLTPSAMTTMSNSSSRPLWNVTKAFPSWLA